MTAGERCPQTSYRIAAGERRLVAQRLDGRVALVDEPTDHDAPVYLVERHVESLVELEGLCAAYIAHSQAADQPAVVAQRELLAGLCERARP